MQHRQSNHAPPSAALRHRRDKRLAAAPTENNNTNKTIRHRPLAARAESKTAARRHAGLGHDQDGEAHLSPDDHHQRRRLRRLRASGAAHAQFTGKEDRAVDRELGSSENSARRSRAALLRGRLEHFYRSIRAAGGGAFGGVCGGVLRALVTGAARFGVGRAGRAEVQVRAESFSALRRRPRAGRRRPAARAGEEAHDRRSCTIAASFSYTA